MGREWYSGDKSICFSKSKTKSKEANGCITGLYHLFRFHYFYFPSRHYHHQPSTDSPSRNPNGLVAPRNSLELTEESPLSTKHKKKDSLSILVGGKKSKLSTILVDTSSDHGKSPNVVARLMGLDLLPDNLDLNKSSRISVRGQRLSGNGSGTRSLPESPRVSSAGKSDLDIRRLSLQLNREVKHEEFGCWRLKELKQDEQSESPLSCGRQTVKQLNEKVVTRTLGMDITNLLENRKTREADNQIELRKVRSRCSQKEKTISSNPTFVFKQGKISQQPTKLILSKNSKENLKRVNEQPLRPINRWKKADRESNFSLHSTPNKNRNRQRRTFISTSTNTKSNGCKKIPKSYDMLNISVSSSAVSATERPRKKMKEAEEPKRYAADVAKCSVMYKYEEKLPQEPQSFNFYDSTTISTTFSEHLSEMKKLKEETETVVVEIERHIVDTLVLEMVKNGIV